MLARVAVLLVVLLAAVPAATARPAKTPTTIRVSLRYDDVSRSWKGTFQSASFAGEVVDRGGAADVRRSARGRWTISRTLTGRRGKLSFRVTGAVRKPVATLRWTLVGGTRAYAGLRGSGKDVEEFSSGRIGVRMDAVPS